MLEDFSKTVPALSGVHSNSSRWIMVTEVIQRKLEVIVHQFKNDWIYMPALLPVSSLHGNVWAEIPNVTELGMSLLPPQLYYWLYTICI
jgi:hypothetical protein